MNEEKARRKREVTLIVGQVKNINDARHNRQEFFNNGIMVNITFLFNIKQNCSSLSI
jgi:hypothetical protein